MLRTVRLSIIKSLFTVHSAMVYVIQVCKQLSSRSICSCSKAVYKPVWHTPLLSVQWINSWWWTDELSETCRVSWQNKFVKLVHLVGHITKRSVTMSGHMNVKEVPDANISPSSKELGFFSARLFWLRNLRIQVTLQTVNPVRACVCVCVCWHALVFFSSETLHKKICVFTSKCDTHVVPLYVKHIFTILISM